MRTSSASLMAFQSLDGTAMPPRGAWITLGRAVPSNTITGVPHAIDSTAIIPKASAMDGIRNTSAAFKAWAILADSFIQPSSIILNFLAKLGTRPTESKAIKHIGLLDDILSKASSIYSTPLNGEKGTARKATAK